MLLRALKVSGFRNLEATTIEPGERFNVFAGNNGQGKTNLLEALYAVCTLRSFRASKLRELIHVHGTEAYVAARVFRGGLERKYELTIKERSRLVRLDDKAVRPISRYFGQFNTVLFAPEDLLVARGSPSDRRKFLDRAVFTLDPSFLAVAQDYEKVLKNRNALLKDEDMPVSKRDGLLDVYDEQLAGLGSQILHARLRYLQTIEPRFAEAFDAIARTGLPCALHYAPAAELDSGVATELSSLREAMHAAITASRRADLARGSSNVGPHRDLLEFRLAEQPAQSFASQGQLRAMILAWKTAELALLAELHEDAPLLLLDDVSSELDPERNEYLFEFLRQQGNQCFITTTHPRFVLLERERRDFRVDTGRILAD